MTMQATLVPASHRSRRRNTLLVLLLALLTRLGVIWYVIARLPAGWLYTHGLEMDLLARSLLAGHGLSSPFGSSPTFETGPTAMISPAYPVFVAAVFRLFGVASVASSVAIMGVHLALNLVTVWLILHLGRHFSNENAAMLMAAFWACSLPIIWMPAIFWETSFSACFLLGFVALALHLVHGSSDRLWIAGGVLCGLAGLFNPALLPSLLTLLAWAAWKIRSLRKSVLALATFALIFSPWPIRNARVFHAFIPARTTVGFELWMGNHDGATGFLEESLFPTFNAAELQDYKDRGERGYFAHKEALATQYIRVHPGQTLRLTFVRIERFWMGTGSQGGSVLFAIHAVITTLLGALGIIFLMRSSHREGAAFFLIPLALFPLPYYLTHAEFRYRLVVDPLLCVLASYALHVRSRKRVSGNK